MPSSNPRLRTCRWLPLALAVVNGKRLRKMRSAVWYILTVIRNNLKYPYLDSQMRESDLRFCSVSNIYICRRFLYCTISADLLTWILQRCRQRFQVIWAPGPAVYNTIIERGAFVWVSHGHNKGQELSNSYAGDTEDKPWRWNIRGIVA